MGQLNLPAINPHGYGIPTILSQWQAGQNRRQKKEEFGKEFKLREDQFEFQQEKFKVEQKEKEAARKTEIGKRGDSFWSQSEKFGDDPKLQGAKNKFRNLALDYWEKGFGVEFDREKINIQPDDMGKAKEMQNQKYSNIQEKINQNTKEGFDDALLMVSGLYADNKNKDAADGFLAQIKTGKEGLNKKPDKTADIKNWEYSKNNPGFSEHLEKQNKSKATQINVPNIHTKIKETEIAKDEAFWMGTKAKPEAYKQATEQLEQFAEQSEIDAKTLEIMSSNIKKFHPTAKLGEINGVVGWYVETDGKHNLVQRWN